MFKNYTAFIPETQNILEPCGTLTPPANTQRHCKIVVIKLDEQSDSEIEQQSLPFFFQNSKNAWTFLLLHFKASILY